MRFLGTTPTAFCPIVTGSVCRRRCRCSCKVRQLYYRERFDVESPNFTGIFTPVGSTTTPDKTSLCTVGSYRRSKRVEDDASDGFKLESPKSAHTTSTPIFRSTIPDIMSLTTSGWQLSKLKNRSKMPHPTASLLNRLR